MTLPSFSALLRLDAQYSQNICSLVSPQESPDSKRTYRHSWSFWQHFWCYSIAIYWIKCHKCILFWLLGLHKSYSPWLFFVTSRCSRSQSCSSKDFLCYCNHLLQWKETKYLERMNLEFYSYFIWCCHCIDWKGKAFLRLEHRKRFLQPLFLKLLQVYNQHWTYLTDGLPSFLYNFGCFSS